MKHIEYNGTMYMVGYPCERADGTWNCLAWRVKKDRRGKECLARKEVRSAEILNELGKRYAQGRSYA